MVCQMTVLNYVEMGERGMKRCRGGDKNSRRDWRKGGQKGRYGMGEWHTREDMKGWDKSKGETAGKEGREG